MYGAETESHFKSKTSNAYMFKGKKNLEGTYDQRSKATSFANINNK